MITITLTLQEILALPGDAVIKLIQLAGDQVDLRQAYDLEAAGRARWPVLNHIRRHFKPTPH
jgi:hypothetical protein